MDKTTKFLLALIAVALIGINIQLYGGVTGLIKPTMAGSSTDNDRYVYIMNWP